MENLVNYKDKYLKYKLKYFELQNRNGGNNEVVTDKEKKECKETAERNRVGNSKINQFKIINKETEECIKQIPIKKAAEAKRKEDEAKQKAEDDKAKEERVKNRENTRKEVSTEINSFLEKHGIKEINTIITEIQTPKAKTKTIFGSIFSSTPKINYMDIEAIIKKYNFQKIRRFSIDQDVKKFLIMEFIKSKNNAKNKPLDKIKEEEKMEDIKIIYNNIDRVCDPRNLLDNNPKEQEYYKKYCFPSNL